MTLFVCKYQAWLKFMLINSGDGNNYTFWWIKSFIPMILFHCLSVKLMYFLFGIFIKGG